MKLRTRIHTTLLILAVSNLSGVSVGCSVLCPMFGTGYECRRCLTEQQECGARGDPDCCEGLRCEHDLETSTSRCVAPRQTSVQD
jgi:hypothetical protein